MSTDFLKEEDVNIESVTNLFKSAFIKTKIDNEKKEVRVELDSLNIDITIEEERKRILFSVFLPLQGKTISEAIAGANHANNTKVLVRFGANQVEDLVFWMGDYTMSYDIGIIPFQIVNMAKLFDRVAIGAVREFLGIE